ncbi:uncharacterized protein [Panulirus ornatus]|uniref:uncharacterized protein isoform X2 n=1 Tax=Panulirus ornatus TaxID=150431 RepID=UPI003A894FEA
MCLGGRVKNGENSGFLLLIKNDPLHDPLGGDPLGDQLEFEVKEEPFEFYEDSICWVSEGVTIIENGEEEYEEKEELEGVPELPCKSGCSKRKVSNQYGTSNASKHAVEGEENCSNNGWILSAKTDDPHNTKMMKSCFEELTDKLKNATGKQIKKEKEEKPSCHVRKNIKHRVKKDNEMKYKEELEHQLARHRLNIKKMQKIIDEERAKMTKVQNILINMRRRHRRHELKQLKMTAMKTEIKRENDDDDEEKLKKKEWEMEIKKQIKAVEADNKKRKKTENMKVMTRKKKFSELTRAEVKVEEIVQSEEKLVDIKKQIKRGLAQEKKMEKREKIKGLQHRERLNELKKQEALKGAKEIIDLERAQVEKIRIEMEEKNVKPEMQIATSHMLWNVLSRIKTEPYVTGSVSNSKVDLQTPNIRFPLRPQSKPSAFDVPHLVKEFMLREDISKACFPSSNLLEEAPGLRYRMHYLSILHKQFVAEHGMLCNYKTFVNFVPSNVLKPSPCFWKTCTCFPCLNPDLKFEKLNSSGIIQMNDLELGDILHDAEKENILMAQLRTMRDSRDILSYDAWERNCSGTINSKRRKVSEPVGIIVAKFLEELSLLKSHIQRTFCQLEAAKLARERAMHSTDEVTLHLDCSPLPIYHSSGPESSSADIATILTILTGYLWNHGGAQAVIAMSDSKDYTTAAVWAGMENILLSLVLAGKSKINVISDSPTNRYRNKSNFYYMSDFAQAYGVCFRWVFLELSHGIGHAGIVRSEFDQVIRDRISCNPNIPVKNSSDVLNMVQAHTTSAVHIYTDQDVQKYKWLLPKLRVVQGTQKFHEVIVLPEDFWVRDVVGHDTYRKLSL